MYIVFSFAWLELDTALAASPRGDGYGDADAAREVDGYFRVAPLLHGDGRSAALGGGGVHQRAAVVDVDAHPAVLGQQAEGGYLVGLLAVLRPELSRRLVKGALPAELPVEVDGAAGFAHADVVIVVAEPGIRLEPRDPDGHAAHFAVDGEQDALAHVLGADGDVAQEEVVGRGVGGSGVGEGVQAYQPGVLVVARGKWRAGLVAAPQVAPTHHMDALAPGDVDGHLRSHGGLYLADKPQVIVEHVQEYLLHGGGYFGIVGIVGADGEAVLLSATV